jgi:hypothetical protein
MTGAEMVLALQEPGTRRAVQQALGLPAEPVAEALRALAASQARTDATVMELGATVKELAAEVKELGAAVKELAAAQARTDAAVARLTEAMQELRRSVGALSDNVGFGLEELAAIVLPGVLEREQGVLASGFERRFVETAAGEEDLDLYGPAERDGRPVTVVGEVKSRIYERDVKAFAAKAERVARALTVTAVPVMFGFVIHPSARQASAAHGVVVVASRPG